MRRLRLSHGCYFLDQMEQASGAAAFVTDQAEAEGEKCFLKVAIAVEKDALFIEESAFARKCARKRVAITGQAVASIR